MFGFFKKNKKMIYVLKLFTIVNYPEAIAYKTLDVLDFCVANKKDKITDVCWNYGNKTWKKNESFRKFEQKQRDCDCSNLYAVELSIYAEEKRLLNFSNTLLNTTKEGRKINIEGTVELTIYIDEDDFDAEVYSDFFQTIAEKEAFDYGYICHIPEKNDTQSVVVNAFQTDIERKAQFAVKGGYIRDAYPYNLLNLCQMENLTYALGGKDVGNFIEISPSLRLLILTLDEVEIIRSLIAFPLLPATE